MRPENLFTKRSLCDSVGQQIWSTTLAMDTYQDNLGTFLKPQMSPLEIPIQVSMVNITGYKLGPWTWFLAWDPWLQGLTMPPLPILNNTFVNACVYFSGKRGQHFDKSLENYKPENS